MVRLLATIFCTMLFFLGVGCSEQAPTPAQVPATPINDMAHAPVPQVLKVVVPESVEGMWRSVKLAVRDQQSGVEDIYSVDLGGSFLLTDETLQVSVEKFLPAFIMDGEKITSVSNQPTNPAALIVIYQDEKEIYNGWLFALYPDTQAYQHPRYNFTLLSYKPAG